MSIGDRLRGPQRRPAVPHRRDHGIGAPNVEEGLLLSGKGQIGEILRVGRRADRQGRAVLRQRCVGLCDLSNHLLGKLDLGEEVANALRRLLKRHRTVLELGPRELDDPRLQVVLRNESAIGGGCHQEPTGHREARRRHARQRPSFAPDQLERVLGRAQG
jgi:hypothetical protein